MFKPELWQSHNEYRTIVSVFGRRLSRNNPKYSFHEYDEERQKLLNLSLDPLTGFIPACYSDTGRPAKHQAQILRSLILFVLLFNKTKARTSLTLWTDSGWPRAAFIPATVSSERQKQQKPDKKLGDDAVSDNDTSRYKLIWSEKMVRFQWRCFLTAACRMIKET